MTALLLCLLTADPSPAYTGPPFIYSAVILQSPHPSSLWVEVSDSSPGSFFLNTDGAPIVWHLDPHVTYDRSALASGTRIRWTGGCTEANRVEVETLGPLAMAAAVEDWVAEVSGDRLETAFSPGQVETARALGSSSWFVREAVSKALAERGVAALRLLVWARRQRDGEVRSRAEALLTRLGWEAPGSPARRR